MLIAWLLVGLMVLMSIAAWARTPADAQLPMQWGIDGRPNWRASRTVALFFAPALAALVLLLFMLALRDVQDERFRVLPIVAAIVFVLAHAGHLVFALLDVHAKGERKAPVWAKLVLAVFTGTAVGIICGAVAGIYGLPTGAIGGVAGGLSGGLIVVLLRHGQRA